MIEFRTEVSTYTVRSGPDGPGPHIRRVHYNRPDRYNFFRAVRDFTCEGEGHPLRWTWPSGYGVTSAEVTRIIVRDPQGNERYSPEYQRRMSGMYEPVIPEPSTYTFASTLTTTPRDPFREMLRNDRENRRQRARERLESRRQEWRRFFGAVDMDTRDHYMELAEPAASGCACSSCVDYACELLAEAGRLPPLAEWEWELMERPIHIPEADRETRDTDPTPGRTRLREVAQQYAQSTTPLPPDFWIRDEADACEPVEPF